MTDLTQPFDEQANAQNNIITWTHDDLKNHKLNQAFLNTDPDENGRILAQLNIINDGFEPKPNTLESGSAIGIKSVDIAEDGTVSVHYENPKDANDDYAQQKYESGNGTFIFPTQNQPELRAAFIDLLNTATNGSNEITLTELDRVLRTAHKMYTDAGVTPDFYNGGLNQTEPHKHIFINREEFAWGGGATKSGGELEFLVVMAPKNQGTNYIGVGENLPKEGQPGSGTSVIVRQGDTSRKLEYGYAVNNLVDQDGNKVLPDTPADVLKKQGINAVRASNPDGQDSTEVSAYAYLY